MPKKNGWEGVLYYGTAGSQGATQITNATDVDYEVGKDYGDTTVRGDGTTIPVADARPTKLSPKITWKMVLSTTDTALTALLANATTTTPTPLAIYAKSYSSGKGFDGDCYLTVKNGQPLNGEQTYEFEATPTTDGGRAPSLNAS
jgi:hypothetical protein